MGDTAFAPSSSSSTHKTAHAIIRFNQKSLRKAVRTARPLSAPRSAAQPLEACGAERVRLWRRVMRQAKTGNKRPHNLRAHACPCRLLRHARDNSTPSRPRPPRTRRRARTQRRFRVAAVYTSRGRPCKLHLLRTFVLRETLLSASVRGWRERRAAHAVRGGNGGNEQIRARPPASPPLLFAAALGRYAVSCGSP